MTLADESQTAFNTRAERSEQKGRGGSSLKVKPETSGGEDAREQKQTMAEL